jgi:hypothetical protein
MSATVGAKPLQFIYSYENVPTIKRFSESSAFIRGLMGPFGCLPAETEFLSDKGWKRMDEFGLGDKVAQWHQSSSRIEFVEPLNRVVMPCDDMLRFKGSGPGSVHMVVSDEHRVPHYNWSGEFSVRTAAQIAAKPSRRTIPTTFCGPIGDGLEMSDDLIRFAVMMHADGHYPKQGKKALICVRKERKKARIRALFQRLEIEFTESVYEKRPTETTFRFVPPYKGKSFGPEWYQANALQLQIILDEIEHWDGLYGHAQKVFSSSDKASIDFIQYVAHACGFRAIARLNGGKDHWQPNWALHIRSGDNHKNRACVREGTRIDRVKTSDGLKYCFEVPSSFFVVRHAGSVFITGNSGKSSGCVVEILRRALAQRPGPDGVRRSRWAIVRNTYAELRMTTVKTVLQWLPKDIYGDFHETNHTYTIRNFEGAEIELVFIALDSDKDVKKLLSLELTGAWVNEAREVPWSIIEVLQGRLGRYPAMRDGGPSWTGLIMDTNPPDADSAWYKFFEEADHSDDIRRLNEAVPGLNLTPETYAAIFKQPSGLSDEAENLDNLQAGYYQRLAIGKSPEWVKIYVKGDYGFVMEGLPVFPEFSDALHLGECKTVRDLPVIRGWDYGLTPSCIFSQLAPSGQLITVDEMTSEGMGIARFAEHVIEHTKIAFPKRDFIDVGDPAGDSRVQTDERTCFEIQRAMGIDIQAAPQTLSIRLESMRKPLTVLRGGRPGFVLHPRCKILRRAFLGGYHYKKMGKLDGEFQQMPNKNRFSHPMDSQTYIAAYLFGDSLTTLPSRGDHMDDEMIFNVRTRSDITGY